MVLAATRLSQGRLIESVDLSEQAYQLGTEIGHTIVQFNATFSIAVQYMVAARAPRIALDWIDRAFAAEHIVVGPSRRAILLCSRAAALGRSVGRDAYDTVHADMAPHPRVYWCCNLARLRDGDFLHYAEYRTTDILVPSIFMFEAGGIVHAFRKHGDLEQAETIARDTLARTEHHTTQAATFDLPAELALVLLAQGRTGDAAELLDTAAAPAGAETIGALPAVFDLARSALALAQHEPANAIQHATAAIDLAARHGDGLLEFDARVALAHAQATSGNTTGACDAFDTALALAERLGLGLPWTDPVHAARATLT